MMESITFAAAQTIAKAALGKFINSGSEELGKASSKIVTEKIMQLGNLVWDRIKGNKAAVEVLEGAVLEQPEETRKLENYLYALWREDSSEFSQESKRLADEIYFELVQIEDNSIQIQNNYGGTNSQNRISGGNVYQGSITINEATRPD